MWWRHYGTQTYQSMGPDTSFPWGVVQGSRVFGDCEVFIGATFG